MTLRLKNSACSIDCIQGMINDQLICRCGEKISVLGYPNWCWSINRSTRNTLLTNNYLDAIFNSEYSLGPAIAHGNMPLKLNLHHYWEVKVMSPIHHNDLFVGIGKPRVESIWDYNWSGNLGGDQQTCGYSYKGKIAYNGCLKSYGLRFGLGSLVGVHVDLATGCLEYYLNRRPLGIAMQNIKHGELYGLVTSTAAKSAVRLTCAVSTEPTLQLLCLEVIRRNAILYKLFKAKPKLRDYYKEKYFWMLPSEELELSLRGEDSPSSDAHLRSNRPMCIED